MPKHMSVKSLRHYLSNSDIRNCDVVISDRDGNEYGICGFSYDKSTDPNTFVIQVVRTKYGSVTEFVYDKLKGE